MLINTVDPLLCPLERSVVGKVKSNQDTLSLSVEILSDGSEFLLARCIPDLYCEGVSIGLELGVDAVYADGLEVLQIHFAGLVDAQQRRFSDRAVA